MEPIQSIIVFEDSIFDNIVEEITHVIYPSFKSHFTDLQAKNICSKMGNHRIRYFSNLFLGDTKQIHKEKLRYQIHYLANKALDFYGSKILTFIYNLKRWPNRTRNTEVYVSALNDIYYSDTNFPKIEIKSFDKGISYTIRFKRAYERPVENIPIVSIRNNYSNTLSKVSRNGLLIENFENATPEILLFQEHINGEFTLYSGCDDDFCDICGRPLTDYISIKYGRGPICRRDYGTP